MRRAGFLPRYPQKNTGRLRDSCFYLSYQYSADGTVARNARQTRFFESAYTPVRNRSKNVSPTKQCDAYNPSVVEFTNRQIRKYTLNRFGEYRSDGHFFYFGTLVFLRLFYRIENENFFYYGVV